MHLEESCFSALSVKREAPVVKRGKLIGKLRSLASVYLINTHSGAERQFVDVLGGSDYAAYRFVLGILHIALDVRRGGIPREFGHVFRRIPGKRVNGEAQEEHHRRQQHKGNGFFHFDSPPLLLYSVMGGRQAIFLKNIFYTFCAKGPAAGEK